MSQLLVKQKLALSPYKLQLVEDVGRKVQADFDRMQPYFQQIFEAQRRILEVYAPIFEAMIRLTEAMRPTLEAIAKMESFAKWATPTVEAEVIPNYTYQIRREPACYVEVEPVVDIVPDVVVSLPDGAVWDYVECRFKDGHTLSVLYKGKLVGNFGHEVLGFARRNTQDGKPNKQWELLKQLSIIYEYSDDFKPTVDNLSIHFKRKKQALHKMKQNLADTIKSAFGIAADPFLSYDHQLGYRIKFKLLPEPDLRGNGELHSSGGKFFDDTTDLDQ